jgi:hypothetical protein
MSVNELRGEIKFGLENLDRVYLRISSFAQQEVEERIKTSALTYECLGYYNAIEHLIVRLLKHLRVGIPSGQFFHRDTLKTFEAIISDNEIEVDGEIVQIIENLMAFRHIATKIYGFLIDWDKLQVIVNEIDKNHGRIKQLFIAILETIE